MVALPSSGLSTLEALWRPLGATLGSPAGGLLIGLAGVVLVLTLLWTGQLRRGRRLTAALQASRQAQSQLRDELMELAVPGLISRSHFEQVLGQAAVDARGQPQPMALLFLNLDNFRTVNESYGFAGGNEVLIQTGRRLVQALGWQPPPAVNRWAAMRMSVDEFVLSVPVGLEQACALAAHLCKVMAEPFMVAGDSPVVLGCSIGIALHPQHGAHARLVSHAAHAMRAVKRAGGGDYMVFEPQMAVDMRRQAELIADLREAVQRGELELWYQPKVEAHTLQITAAEALLRWRHPVRGLVPPGIFIPVAERCGLIRVIGDWVIDEATRQAGAWRDQGLRMRVAINLSAYQMRQDDLVERITRNLDLQHLSPHRFTVEITESVAMEDTKVTQRAFARLREAGLHVSIDDFGVGQASLSYLRRLPAAELKIDASFVRDVAASEDARAIVEAVVKMAHALGLKVVAEGVETEAQRDTLRVLGCDELQGYLFARPMPAKALVTWAMLDAAAPTGAPDAASAFRPSLFQDSQLPEAEEPEPHPHALLLR